MHLYAYPDLSIVSDWLVYGSDRRSRSLYSGSSYHFRFADNYLPIILGKAVASPQTKFIVGTMSILELIYMSEIGALLISTKLVKNMGHVALIFIERTVIALPFVVLISTIIF